MELLLDSNINLIIFNIIRLCNLCRYLSIFAMTNYHLNPGIRIILFEKVILVFSVLLCYRLATSRNTFITPNTFTI